VILVSIPSKEATAKAGSYFFFSLLIFAVTGCDLVGLPAVPGEGYSLPPSAAVPAGTAPVSVTEETGPTDESCGNVTEAGLCSGDTLYYCQDNVLTVYACGDAGYACGFDTANQWYDCVEAEEAIVETTTPSAPMCNVGYEGSCTGDILSFCLDGEEVMADCAEYDGVCGWDPTFERFDCISDTVVTTEIAPDTCGSVSYDGECNGDVLTWCEDDSVQTMACDGVCGFDETNGYYNCLEEVTTSGCGDLDEAGTCAGDTVYWCDGESTQSMECEYGCGWNDEAGYFDCL
jgi:hypothetical protein